MFKKDNWLLGIIIGVLTPAIIYALIYLAIYLFGSPEYTSSIFNTKNALLLSVFINLIPFRYYMVNLKYDKTGRGILLITLVYVLYFFIQLG